MQKRKQKPIDELDPRKPIEHFFKWTRIGWRCEITGNDCTQCEAILYGLDKSTGCRQPEVNEHLKSKNIKPKLKDIL